MFALLNLNLYNLGDYEQFVLPGHSWGVNPFPLIGELEVESPGKQLYPSLNRGTTPEYSIIIDQINLNIPWMTWNMLHLLQKVTVSRRQPERWAMCVCVVGHMLVATNMVCRNLSTTCPSQTALHADRGTCNFVRPTVSILPTELTHEADCWTVFSLATILISPQTWEFTLLITLHISRGK